MRVRRSSPNGGAGNWLVRVLSSSTSRIITVFIFLTAIILFVRQYSENDTSALLVLLSNKYLEESKDEGQSKRCTFIRTFSKILHKNDNPTLQG